MENPLPLWKTIFSDWKYTTLAIVIAFLFYFLNVLISSWSSLVGSYPSFGFFGTIKFFFILAWGFKGIIFLHSYISVIFISVLFGMLFSLVGYKINLGKGYGGKNVGFFGGIGIFLGALVPGCAACGVGLISLLGVSAGFLSFFPYDGLELSIISIGILGFIIMKVTNEMYICKTSKFTVNRKLKGGKKNE